MTISKIKFFAALALLIVAPLVTYKINWLVHSEKTEGIMAFEGAGNAGDQIRLDYSVICFRYGNDSIWFNGLGNLHLHPGEAVPVRYQSEDPTDAKVDLFAAIWGDTLVYGSIPLLMLLFMFLHSKVVPRGSKLRLTRKKPYIAITTGPQEKSEAKY